MPIGTAIATGVGLSMDALAVCISTGLAAGGRVRSGQALAMAGCFGAFQAAMPSLGCLGGAALSSSISAFDHWVAFGLLGAIGGKMLWEGGRGDGEEGPRSDPYGWRSLLLLGIATSIDALAVGVTIAVTPALHPWWRSVLIIGATTFLLCLPAAWLSRAFAWLGHGRAQIIGGAVLVGLGSKILIEHLAGA
jgi:putative Mn2+ efflux pump MntP